MSGPQEVDIVVSLVSEGLRTKMLRPKCLARPSWLLDSDSSLLARLADERGELAKSVRDYRRFVSPTGATSIDRSLRRDIFLETCDVAAFGAMLVDARRTTFILDSFSDRKTGWGEDYR